METFSHRSESIGIPIEGMQESGTLQVELDVAEQELPVEFRGVRLYEAETDREPLLQLLVHEAETVDEPLGQP